MRAIRNGDHLDHSPVGLQEVVAEVTKMLSETGSAGELKVAILDSLPGRTASLAYRQFLSNFPVGYYLAPDRPGQAALRGLARMTGEPATEFGVDLEQSKTIVGLAAGLLEGWGNPGKLFQQAADESEKNVEIIQIETRQSNTAALANAWIPVRPGTETVFCLGLAASILSQKLYDPKLDAICPDLAPNSEFAAFLSNFDPDTVGRACAIEANTVTDLARRIAGTKPAVVLSGGDEGSGTLGRQADLAANVLNVLLGSLGSTGGFVARRPLPAPAEPAPVDLPTVSDIAQVPDGSIRVLIIDATIPTLPVPERLLRRKLDPQRSIVVCLSMVPVGYGQVADYLVPTPGYLESAVEMPSSFDSPVASFAVSTPLVTAPADLVTPLDFLNQVAQASGKQALASGDELIESRIQAIWDSRRGSLRSYVDGALKPVTEFTTAEEFSKALRADGQWVDTPSESKAPTRVLFTGSPEWTELVTGSKAEIEPEPAFDSEYPLVLIPYGNGFMAGVSSPLTAKLSRESGLYAQTTEILLNPSDAVRLEAANGDGIQLETPAGRATLRARLDEGVMPGTVFVPAFSFGAAPEADIRSLCSIETDGSWRITRARIRRA